MGVLAFLVDDLVRAAPMLTTSRTMSGEMVLSNLQDPQPRMRARFVGTFAEVLIDFGGTVSMDCVAFISTNATAAATYRVRLSTVDATGAAGDAWDTTTTDAYTGDDAGGNVVVVKPDGAASGRYLLARLTDATLGYVDVGLVVAGALWRVSRSIATGYREGRVILDRRDRNAVTAAQFTAPAVGSPRYCEFDMALLTQAEATTSHRNMVRKLGAARDALWIPDIALSQAEINARSLYGAVAQPGERAGLTRPSPVARFSRSLMIEERA